MSEKNQNAVLDINALLQKKDLPNFINPNQDEDGGAGAQQQSTSLAMTKGIAALREAQGLSNSYAPANSGKEVAAMAASAQYNLGIEAAHGLSPTPGPSGSNLGASDDEAMKRK